MPYHLANIVGVVLPALAFGKACCGLAFGVCCHHHARSKSCHPPCSCLICPIHTSTACYWRWHADKRLLPLLLFFLSWLSARLTGDRIRQPWASKQADIPLSLEFVVVTVPESGHCQRHIPCPYMPLALCGASLFLPLPPLARCMNL